MRIAVGFALCLIPVIGLAAPVPGHLMPRVELQLRYDPAEHPLGNTYHIVIRNTGSADLQIWTDRPLGIAAFLDVEIENDSGKRLSRPYAWRVPAANGDPVVLRETIPANRAASLTLPLFTSVDDKSLTPGKYRVRARFHYKDHDAVTEWIEVHVLESQIRTKHLVAGRY
jgi:hypothetical protein